MDPWNPMGWLWGIGPATVTKAIMNSKREERGMTNNTKELLARIDGWILDYQDYGQGADTDEIMKLARDHIASTGDGWMDISTAPKDGEWLLMSRGGIPYVACWDDEDGVWFTFNRHYEDTLGKRNEYPDDYQPLFWQPLPPKPEANNG